MEEIKKYLKYLDYVEKIVDDPEVLESVGKPKFLIYDEEKKTYYNQSKNIFDFPTCEEQAFLQYKCLENMILDFYKVKEKLCKMKDDTFGSWRKDVIKPCFNKDILLQDIEISIQNLYDELRLIHKALDIKSNKEIPKSDIDENNIDWGREFRKALGQSEFLCNQFAKLNCNIVLSTYSKKISKAIRNYNGIKGSIGKYKVGLYTILKHFADKGMIEDLPKRSKFYDLL